MVYKKRYSILQHARADDRIRCENVLADTKTVLVLSDNFSIVFTKTL